MKKAISYFLALSTLFSLSNFKSFGMEANLEQSLFLKAEEAWLKEKIEEKVEEKIYKDTLCGKTLRRKADTEHIYVINCDLEGTLTNSGKIADVIVPFKPADGSSYKDFKEEETGGYLYFFVSFKKPQKETLKEEDFLALKQCNSTTITGGQAEDDKAFDESLTAEKDKDEEKYNWIETGNATRQYVSLPYSMASGYLIKNQSGNEIFWVRLGDINVGLESKSFVSVEAVKECIEESEKDSAGYFL